MNSLFWPRRKQHTIRMVQLLAPQSLRPELTSQLRLSLSLVNALRSVQDLGLDGLYLASELKKKIANSLSNASYFLQDDESRSAIGFIAEGLMEGPQQRAMGQALAGIDEKELVGYIGSLSTWLGKSREMFYSAFFGTPNFRLQQISDVVDELVMEALQRISHQLHTPLQAVPGCAYKIIDLFGISGEANYFPKHFAYFMPEDQGVKYSTIKRTIVFSNTYRSLYEHISLDQAPTFGWTDNDLPSLAEVDRYLIAWFRGHDLGHSIIMADTCFGRLSKSDRWGSMVVQEALADVFGFLLSVDQVIAARLRLDQEKMVRVYVLELFRYLRRGPSKFPDAGSAYIQLRILQERGVITISPTGLTNVNINHFIEAMGFIADELIKNVLAGHTVLFQQFIKKYCPHLIEGQESDFLFGMDMCDITLGYEQDELEGVQYGVQ